MLRNDEKKLDVSQNLASTSAIASLRWGLIGAVDVFFCHWRYRFVLTVLDWTVSVSGYGRP